MKKNKIFYSVATTAAALVMTAAPIIPTFADADVTKQSDATFTVTEKSTTPPDIPTVDIPDTNQEGDGALQLVAVPSFDFGTVSTTELMAGKTGLTSSSIAKDPKKTDGSGEAADDAGATSGTPATANTNRHLTVSDLRGSDNNWDLSATLSTFKSDDGKSELTGTLNLKSTQKAVQDEYAAGADGTGTTPYTQDFMTLKDFSDMDKAVKTGETQTLYTASNDNGRGINVARLDTSTLDLDKNTTAQAGHYTATIDWELKSVSATPDAG